MAAVAATPPLPKTFGVVPHAAEAPSPRPQAQDPLPGSGAFFRGLWDQLHALHPADDGTLRAGAPWVLKGCAAFKPYTEASRAALERARTAADLGMPPSHVVDEGSRRAALDVADAIGLDALQAYALVHGMEGDAAHAAGSLSEVHDARFVFSVCNLYFQERQALLECALEFLRLDLREGDGSAGHRRHVRDVVGTDADAQIEARAWESLEAAVAAMPVRTQVVRRPDPSPSAAGPSAASALGPCPDRVRALGLDSFWIEQQTLEQVLLFQQIFLVYYEERHRAGAAEISRLLRLADALDPERFASMLSDNALANLRALSSVAYFCFVEMLDADGILVAIAGGQAGESEGEGARGWEGLLAASGDVGAFLSSEVSRRPHVALAWAIFRGLGEVLREGRVNSVEVAEASAAIAQGALVHMHGALVSSVVRASTDSTAFHSVLKNFMSGFFLVLDVTPTSLAQEPLHLLAQIIASCYTREPMLVAEFWTTRHTMDHPIRSFFQQCQLLFPCAPLPYLTMLNALCGGTGREGEGEAGTAEGGVPGSEDAASDDALEHFRGLRSLSVYHEPGDLMEASTEISLKHQLQDRLSHQVGKDVRILKHCVFEIPGCSGLFINDQSVGRVLEYYGGPGRAQAGPSFLVRWAVDVDGYYIMLSQLLTFSSAQDWNRGAAEVTAYLRFLKAAVSASRAHWESLARVRLGDSGVGVLDVLQELFQRFMTSSSYADNAQAVSRCSEILAECLDLAKAVSRYEPEAIAAWLTSMVPVTGGSDLGDRVMDLESLVPSLHVVYAMEIKAGDFVCTVAFVKLVASLAQKGVCRDEIAAYLYYAVFGILARIHTVTSRVKDQDSELVCAVYDLVQSCVGSYAFVKGVNRIQTQAVLDDFDWPAQAKAFTGMMSSLLNGRLFLSSVLQSSALLMTAMKAESLRMKGQLDRVATAERLIGMTCAMLMKLFRIARSSAVSKEAVSWMLSSVTSSNGSQSIAYVTTSYCAYQFDVRLRKQAFDVLLEIVRLASECGQDHTIQHCFPYSLTLASSKKFRMVLADSLSPEELLRTQDLFVSIANFLTYLIYTNQKFPSVLIPQHATATSDAGSHHVGAQWIASIKECVVSDACRREKPFAYTKLMQFLELVWEADMSFISNEMLSAGDMWPVIERHASEKPDWSYLDGWASGEVPSVSNVYATCIHAHALKIVAHEFFVSKFSATESGSTSVGTFVKTHFCDIVVECSSIRIGLHVRQDVLRGFRKELTKCSLDPNLFCNQGIKRALSALHRMFERKARESMANADDVIKDGAFEVDSIYPVEQVLMQSLGTVESLDAFWVDEHMPVSDKDVNDTNASMGGGVKGIQAYIEAMRAHSMGEVAAANTVMASKSIGKILGDAGNLSDCLGSQDDSTKIIIHSLADTLSRLTNRDEPSFDLKPKLSVEQFVYLVAEGTMSVLHSILDKGYGLAAQDSSGSIQLLDCLHRWLVYLTKSSYANTPEGNDLTLQALIMTGSVCSHLVRSQSYVEMESVLKTFGLACALCCKQDRLRLVSLSIIKDLLEKWLSVKMNQGEWVSMMHASPIVNELCSVGDVKTSSAELRQMLLMTATSIAGTRNGAGFLLRLWKERGTFQRLIEYSSFLIGKGSEVVDEWRSWLELIGTLLSVCSELDAVCDGLDALMVFSMALFDELESYIASLLSSFRSEIQTLRYGDLDTVRYAAFMLNALVKFAARWDIGLPACASTVQRAALDFLLYAAQPGLKPYSSYDPQFGSKEEKQWHDEETDVCVAGGWFTVLGNDPHTPHAPTFSPRLKMPSSATPGRTLPPLTRYALEIGCLVYTNVALLEEFLLVSQVSCKLDAPDAFNVATVGVQMQLIHVIATLVASRFTCEPAGRLMRLCGVALDLSTRLQDAMHDRNDWRLMSSLTASYLVLKDLMDAKAAAGEAASLSHTNKVLGVLQDSAKSWSRNFANEDVLTGTASLLQ